MPGISRTRSVHRGSGYEPELLEVRDVAEVPDDGTHQRIVLQMQIFVGQHRYQQQRALARIREQLRDFTL